MRGYFEVASEEDYGRSEIDNEETSEEGHGRSEHRSYFLSTDLSSLSGVAKWNGLKAIGMVQCERHCAGRVSCEQRYYITSLGDAKLFQRAVRSHWGIENGLHWRLDVTFREDESRIRRGNAPHNVGVIRHMAVSVFHVPCVSATGKARAAATLRRLAEHVDAFAHPPPWERRRRARGT